MARRWGTRRGLLPGEKEGWEKCGRRGEWADNLGGDEGRQRLERREGGEGVRGDGMFRFERWDEQRGTSGIPAQASRDASATETPGEHSAGARRVGRRQRERRPTRATARRARRAACSPSARPATRAALVRGRGGRGLWRGRGRGLDGGGDGRHQVVRCPVVAHMRTRPIRSCVTVCDSEDEERVNSGRPPSLLLSAPPRQPRQVP